MVLLAENYFPRIGEMFDLHQVHSSIIQPYIANLCKHIDNRFGDGVGRLSTAALIFNPSVVVSKTIEEQNTYLRLVCEYYKVNANVALDEWKTFINYLH